jgi:hypothetical protein
MQSTFKIENDLRFIRRWILFFMVSLFVSGVTAIPVEWELSIIKRFFSLETRVGDWLQQVYLAVKETGSKYPFLLYGYDWLAFAHIVLAMLFIGPYKDPVRNKWVIEFAMYACMLVIPFALIAGHFRGVPLWWRFIDCAFGIVGVLPLVVVYLRINWVELVNREHV